MAEPIARLAECSDASLIKALLAAGLTAGALREKDLVARAAALEGVSEQDEPSVKLQKNVQKIVKRMEVHLLVPEDA